MGMTVKYECDYMVGLIEPLTQCGEPAVYEITTEIQNESTVFNVARRYSCDDRLHTGSLVTDKQSLVEIVQEATAKDAGSKRVYPVDKWIVRGINVRFIDDQPNTLS